MIEDLLGDPTGMPVDEARTKLLHRLTGIVHHRHAVESSDDSARRHPLYMRAVELLEEQVIFPGADQVSRLMAVPRPVLDEAFHRTLGISLTSYIARRRLVEVRRRLQDTSHDETVAEILRRSSALDHFELRRQYRQLFSESPSQTRQRSMSGTVDAVRRD